MIKVSDDFSNSVSKTEREMKGYVEVIFTSSDAKNNAKVTDYPAILKIGDNFISANGIIDDDRKGKNYASLERDYFQLDGTFVLPNNEASKNSGMGYVSQDTFENDKEIPINPFKISTSYTTQEKVDGITMYFINNTPLQLEIQITSDGKTETFSESDCIINDRGVVQLIFEERVVDIINIYVKDVLYPDRRIRLQEVDFGLSDIYEGEDLMSFKVIEQCSRFADEMPINECTIEIGDYSNNFDVNNPKNIIKYLGNNVLIKPYIGVITNAAGIEYCTLGTYWLESYQKNGGSATLTAKSIFNKLLDYEYYLCGFTQFHATPKQLLDNLIYEWDELYNITVEDDLEDTDLIDNNFLVNISFSPLVNKLTVLQEIAILLGHTFIATRAGQIKTANSKIGTINKTINVENMKDYANINVGNKLKIIKIAKQYYNFSTEGKNKEVLINDNVNVTGVKEFIYDFGGYKTFDIKISALSGVGGEYAKVVKWSNTELPVDGSNLGTTRQNNIKSYLALRIEYEGQLNIYVTGCDTEKSERIVEYIYGETGKELNIQNNFIIEQSQDAIFDENYGEKLQQFMNEISTYRNTNQNKNTLSCSYNGDPSIELGDTIQVENKYPDKDGNIRYDKVWVTKIESEFKGSFNQSIEGDIIE